MIRKLLYTSLIAIIVGGIQLSCSENISDCPSKMCLLTNDKGWQLVEIYEIYGEEVIKKDEDLSQYRIIFDLADDKDTLGTYIRTNSSGRQDQGTWKVPKNLDKFLAVIPATTPEEPYIIESFSPRQLVLILNRESTKTGPSQLKYVFEPI